MNKEEDLLDLDIGSSFEFRNVLWTVEEAYLYDWNDEETSKEFKIVAGKETAFLEIEMEEDEMFLNFSTEINKKDLVPDIEKQDFMGDDLVTKVSYKDITYKLKDVDEGLFTDLSEKDDSMEFTNFDYYFNDSYISISLWEDDTLDCSVGQTIELDLISNINNNLIV